MIVLTINGTGYDYPEQGDQRWGADAKSWAQAVTSGMLQKAGGSFILLAEVDFGGTYGLKSVYYKSRAANAAAAGQIRLGNTESLSWRNAANGADLALSANASDRLIFNAVTIPSISSTDTLTNKTMAFGSNTFTGVLITANGGTGQDFSASTGFIYDTAGTMSAKSVTEATSLLNNVVGDSGAGGIKGLVPAPAAGDTAANKFLKANGVWTVPTGAGDVTGPVGATADGFVRFNGTTGTVIKDSPATIVNADVNAAAAIAYTKLNLSTSIVNADINASAAIAFSKLAALTSANILVGNVSNVAAAVAVTGDISISNAGVTAYSGVVPMNKGGSNKNMTAVAGGIVYSDADSMEVTSAGTAAQYLSSNGSSAPSWATFTQPTVSIATATAFSGGMSAASSGTYTTPAGVKRIRVQMVGGGSSGAGSGVATPTAGNAGGNTTFGSSLLTAAGGTAPSAFTTSSASGNGPAGGAVTINSPAIEIIKAPGGYGGAAQQQIAGTIVTRLAGGNGGNSFFGGAGTGSFGSGTAATSAVTDSGSGGGGGGINESASASTGPGGAPGGYLMADIVGPSATYPFAIGAGGVSAAGTAGGASSGAGAAGKIIVEEFYQ